MKLTITVAALLANTSALENVEGDSKVERAVWDNTDNLKYKN